MDPMAVVGGSFAALYAAHMVGDHWVQSDHDAQHKGLPGWTGRWSCARHVLTMTFTKLVFLVALEIVTGFDPHPAAVWGALAIDAASHYWADRRTTLAALAALIPGKAKFYRLGTPRPGHDDNPSIGTGAYALDQSWHIGWLFVAALILSI